MEYYGIVLASILSVSLVNATSRPNEIIDKQRQAISSYEILEQERTNAILSMTPSTQTELDKQLESRLLLARKKNDLMKEILELETKRLQSMQPIFFGARIQEEALTAILQSIFAENWELRYNERPTQILEHFRAVFWQIYSNATLNEILQDTIQEHQPTINIYGKEFYYVGSFAVSSNVNIGYCNTLISMKSQPKSLLSANLQALQLIGIGKRPNDIPQMSLHELIIWTEYSSKSIELNKQQLIDKCIELLRGFDPASSVEKYELTNMSCNELVNIVNIINNKLRCFHILRNQEGGTDDEIRKKVNAFPADSLQVIIQTCGLISQTCV